MKYNFPAPEESPAYFKPYLAKVEDQDDILQFLEKQQKEVADLMVSLSEDQLNHAYDEGKWTVKEVFRHILDTERVFAYRAFCFARGEEQSLPGFDDNLYVQNSMVEDLPIEKLIEEYKTIRAATIIMFRNFDVSVRLNIGLGNKLEMTVRAILYITAGHELHHLNVIKERYL